MRQQPVEIVIVQVDPGIFGETLYHSEQVHVVENTVRFFRQISEPCLVFFGDVFRDKSTMLNNAQFTGLNNRNLPCFPDWN